MALLAQDTSPPPLKHHQSIKHGVIRVVTFKINIMYDSQILRSPLYFVDGGMVQQARGLMKNFCRRWAVRRDTS